MAARICQNRACHFFYSCRVLWHLLTDPTSFPCLTSDHPLFSLSVSIASHTRPDRHAESKSALFHRRVNVRACPRLPSAIPSITFGGSFFSSPSLCRKKTCSVMKVGFRGNHTLWPQPNVARDRPTLLHTPAEQHQARPSAHALILPRPGLLNLALASLGASLGSVPFPLVYCSCMMPIPIMTSGST
ncbi:hypothetical protein BCV70DRAFT_9187 [Testicularia cyperi]|uniref:Uncharacterized protein n=1 Tax=Testicularia cyperi TaxID=1882483 RepID=A0A317XYW5_9BASI|nr:hypothetical protein BCV70DRAFT_9187 [Testicularia cyperi]